MQRGGVGGSPALTFPSTSQVTYLRNYFEYEDEPGQAESAAWWRERRAWSYAAATQPSPAAGWRAEIAGTSPNQLLRVTGPASSNTQSPKTINVAVTVTKRVIATVEETATVRFTFSLEEPEDGAEGNAEGSPKGSPEGEFCPVGQEAYPLRTRDGQECYSNCSLDGTKTWYVTNGRPIPRYRCVAGSNWRGTCSRLVNCTVQ